MYKISKKDAGKMVFFLNGMMVVPSVGESRDAVNGIDMSEVSYREEEEQEKFIEEFNEKYAKDASPIKLRGVMDAIAVNQELIDEEGEEDAL